VGLFPRSENPLASLWRLRLRTAVILSLPILLLGLWYAYRAATPPFTVESFHIQLHDQIRRDLRHLFLPPPPEEPSIPVFSLTFLRSDLQKLTAHIGTDARREYVPVLVSKDGGTHLPARARLRGSQPWHWAYPQKSVRIVMNDGTYLEGESTFNLINEVAPIGVGEDLIHDVLDDLGIITPRYRPVRVEINNRNMGVYFQATQPDESLLRRHRRAYGGLFSGNEAPVDPDTGRSTLFQDPDQWKNVAGDGREIDRLLRMVTDATDAEFTAFAREEMDIRKFAAFDAVDVVFGGAQHDWDQNHKIYLDPYTGKFEPVAWNFRGWSHAPTFQIAENPLRLRLARVPGYLTRRDRIVYDLLTGDCAVHEIRRRLRDKMERTAAEHRSDPHWDAYKLLPRVSREMRRRVRPMDADRQAMVLESEIKNYAQRHAYLTEALERNDVRAVLKPGKVDVIVGGHGGCILERASVPLHRDGEEPLYPAAVTVLHPDPSPSRGHLSLAPAPRRYRFVIDGESVPEKVVLDLRSAVTGWRFTVEATREEIATAPDGDPGTVPALQPGETGCHPWLLERPPRQPVTIGPGEVTFEETRVFGEDEPVTILPGTDLRLGDGASLIFLSALEAEGPITISPMAGSFGGIALQGEGTAGSRLSGVRISGGTAPAYRLVRYPATVNIHATSDIHLKDCEVRGNEGSEDSLHVAYGRNIRIESCQIRDATQDAIDLEFTTAEILSTRIVRAGDEGIDLQASEVSLTDSVIVGTKGSGISTGERSAIEITGSLIARCGTGVLVKSRSDASFRGSLLVENEVALRNESISPKYGGRSRLLGDVLAAVRCDVLVETDDGSETDIVRVISRLPQDGSLTHLGRDVLGIEAWSDLEARIDDLLEGP
jgi:hypothetical protein